MVNLLMVRLKKTTPSGVIWWRFVVTLQCELSMADNSM